MPGAPVTITLRRLGTSNFSTLTKSVGVTVIMLFPFLVWWVCNTQIFYLLLINTARVLEFPVPTQHQSGFLAVADAVDETGFSKCWSGIFQCFQRWQNLFQYLNEHFAVSYQRCPLIFY
jgi:hypothetical protein